MDMKPRGGFASDEGMSVLEIVLAAFILFFVLTAVLGLVWTTTRMGVDAKERSAVTNALTSHMEWIRSLDYEEVGLQGTDPSATVPAQKTAMIDGFTVVINTTVTTGSKGVKEVQVDATATRTGYPTLTMSQHASVRDYESSMTQMTSSEQITLSFGSRTPPENSVVYSSYVKGGSLLYIEADAETDDPSNVITELKFTCSGQILRDGTSIHSDVAAWQPMTDIASEAFNWSTVQVGNDGEPDVITDGWRLVRIEATDSEGGRAVKERRFLVDNDPPGPPGTPKAQVLSDVEARLSWTSAMDGTDDAWGYGVKISKVGSTGDLIVLNPLTPQGDPDDYKVTPPAYIQATTAFSRYVAEVRSYSPRQMTSDYLDVEPVDYTSGPKVYVSRPLVAGYSVTAYSGKNAARTALTTVSGSVTPPTFGCSTLRYDLYRGLSPASMSGTLFATDTTSTFADSITKVVGKFGTPDPYYYQYKITYRPLGSTAGTSDEVIWSNVIGPTTANEVTTIMPFTSW